MMDRKPAGPFILWVNYGSEGWSPRDCATLDEAVEGIGQWGASTWVITKAPVKLVEAGAPVDIPSPPA